MKKFTALFLLMFALALNANADSKAGQKYSQRSYPLPMQAPAEFSAKPEGKDSKSQAAPTFNWVLDQRSFANPFYSDANVVVFEPKSRNTYFVTSANNFPTGGTPYSTDTLHTLTPGASSVIKTTIVDDSKASLFQYSSLAVLDAADSPENARIAVMHTGYEKVSPYSFAGGLLLLRDGGDSQIEVLNKPLTNASPAQNLVFSSAPITTYTENDNSVLHIATGMTSLEGSGVNPFHQGYYGYVGFDFNEGYTANIVPEQWYATLFRGRDNAGTGGYQTPMLTDVDSKGNVYTAINNIFSDDINTRVFAFSKSTDKGKTWSSFKRIGTDVLTAYAESQGFTSIGTPARMAYGQNGFAVTGEDEMSYIFSAVLSRDQESTYQLIEVFYKGGNFGIRKVADLDVWEWTVVDRTQTFFPIVIDYVNENFPADPGQDTIMAKINESGQGHEIQVSKTADGKDLIVKWVHNRNQKTPILTSGAMYPIVDDITDDQGVDIDNAVIMRDSLTTTDLFMAHRSINATSWSNPINITDDEKSDLFTQMPKFQESINKVKVTRYEPFFYWTQFPNFPPSLVARAFGMPGRVFMADFDLLTTGVEVDQAPTSYNFNLYDVAPNPATEQTNISYSLNAPSFVNLEVFDAMGNKVATLFNGNLSEGFYATPYDVTALASGSYFYSLTVNGVTLTKTLNVVK